MIVWARLAVAVASLMSAILAAVQRARDRQAGRDQQRAADLQDTARILEGQRDEASRPLASPDELLDRMRRGGL